MPPALRVMIVAPFARDLAHGGSQRSTAIAERLEARGAIVGWTAVVRRAPSRLATVAGLARGRPTLELEYAPEVPDGTWAAVLAAHSYLAASIVTRAPVVADFHNLEWQHLADVAASAEGTRQAWLRTQVSVMRRRERGTLRERPLSLLASDAERNWAERAAPEAAGRLLVVPNRLPRAECDAAARIAAARRRESPSDGLAYLGTLRFPPNRDALARFLRDVWPAVRAARPAAVLHVAGGLGAPEPEPRLRAPGVRHHGYVEDLEGLLARVAAVVFPFAGAAGSSLRALFLAAAAVPVVGDGPAFRGHGAALGVGVSAPGEWAEAIAEARREPVAEAAQAAALALQADERPWDELHARLAALAPSVARSTA